MSKQTLLSKINLTLSNKNFLILILAIILGAFLRFYLIGTFPPILNRDEAAIAYNSKLLLDSGRDEWQKSWPLVFKSFGDYKLPGYHWITVASFFIFGVSDWSLRFGSALAGVILIFITYLFAKDFFQDELLSLMAALLVATGPVFIFYSRMGYEANVGLVLLISSLWLLLNKKFSLPKDVFAIFLWLLATLTYNTPLLLIPLLIPLVVFRRNIKKTKRWMVPVIGLAVVFALVWFKLGSLSAAKGNITIFQDEAITIHYGDFRQQFDPIIRPIVGSRVVYLSSFIVENIKKSFSYEFLVVRGGEHPWHALPGWGHMYWQVYLLGWLGMITSIFKLVKKFRLNFDSLFEWLASSEFSLFWLLFAGLAASVVTVDSPHATRSLLFLFTWVIFAVLGIQSLVEFANKKMTGKTKKMEMVLYSIVLVVIMYEAIRYGFSSFVNYPLSQAEALRAGYERVLDRLPLNDEDVQIAVVDPDGYQYILTAWYARIDSDVFFQTVHRQLPNQIGFEYVDYLSNIHFIGAASDRENETILVQWTGIEWKITNY